MCINCGISLHQSTYVRKPIHYVSSVTLKYYPQSTLLEVSGGNNRKKQCNAVIRILALCTHRGAAYASTNGGDRAMGDSVQSTSERSFCALKWLYRTREEVVAIDRLRPHLQWKVYCCLPLINKPDNIRRHCAHECRSECRNAKLGCVQSTKHYG